MPTDDQINAKRKADAMTTQLATMVEKIENQQRGLNTSATFFPASTAYDAPPIRNLTIGAVGH